MSGHTPGPWTASRAPGNWYATRWNVASCVYSTPTVTDGRDSIADVRGQDEANAGANARLVAASPDMLAALDYIVHWEATEGWSPDRARDMAVAALAKARGEVVAAGVIQVVP